MEVLDAMEQDRQLVPPSFVFRKHRVAVEV
jgi:hypothetical protein